MFILFLEEVFLQKISRIWYLGICMLDSNIRIIRLCVNMKWDKKDGISEMR